MSPRRLCTWCQNHLVGDNGSYCTECLALPRAKRLCCRCLDDWAVHNSLLCPMCAIEASRVVAKVARAKVRSKTAK